MYEKVLLPLKIHEKAEVLKICPIMFRGVPLFLLAISYQLLAASH